ncbi:MAG: 30S ribosome-binding factor RbfA [Anaerolineae bacterium]|nr:30S ribosome-binding factor RbfA [Anaerolineae bacterium]
MGKKYQQRVSQMIQRKVTQLLITESNDPRLSRVNITDVSVNRDTTRAEIYYSIMGTEEELEEVQQALNKAANWMRAELAPTLRLRNVPQLVFVYDPSLAYGSHIDTILEQLHNEEQPRDTTTGDDTP